MPITGDMMSFNKERLFHNTQFFITKTDATWLNGQYTNFGNVTEGMDIVKKIEIGDKILQIEIL